VTEKVVEEVVGSAVKEWLLLSAGPLTEFETTRLEIPEAGIVVEGDVPVQNTSKVVIAQFNGKTPATMKGKVGAKKPVSNEQQSDLLMLQLIFYRACGLAVEKIQIIAMKVSFAEYMKERDASPCTSFEIGWANDEAPTTEEATAWLAALVELYRRSAEKPVPTFAPHSDQSQSTTTGYLFYLANKPEEALKTFDNEINKVPSEYSAGFAGTEEALIYGVEPKFADCFPVAKSAAETKPFEQQFWLDRYEWWVRPSWSASDSPPQFVAEVEVPKALRPSAHSVTDGSS
jgi:hypothetical protein